LSPYPFLEVTWAGWKSLHPNTLALGSFSVNEAQWGPYPYFDYRTSQGFFSPTTMPPLDGRLPPKERVLGVPDEGQGGLAFPFGTFQEAGSVGVAHGEVSGKALVVFWRGDLEGAAAYWADADGQVLTFAVEGGSFVDNETGTTWDFLGVGSGGGLDGVRLDPVPEAVVAYWGAWAAFYPETEIWESG
jgi:hypothetical protein